MNTKEKSLYRDVLEKQLAFLEEAQKDAAENYKFTVITYYTKDILNLAKEIDKLDSQHDDSEKADEFPLDSFSTAENLYFLRNELKELGLYRKQTYGAVELWAHEEEDL